MSKAYEYSTVIERKIEGHLKSLGFNIHKPKERMTISHKIAVLNYLRTIETAIHVVQHAVTDTPIIDPGS